MGKCDRSSRTESLVAESDRPNNRKHDKKRQNVVALNSNPCYCNYDLEESPEALMARFGVIYLVTLTTEGWRITSVVNTSA